MRFGVEASYADGSPAPIGMLGDNIKIDSDTGEMKISGFKGDLLLPQKDSLRIRFVAERIGESGEPPKPVIQRYASKFIPVITLDEDGSPIKGKVYQSNLNYLHAPVDRISLKHFLSYSRR